MDATDSPIAGTGAIDLEKLDRYAFKIAEAARLLSLSERTIKALIASGELESVKLGRARRVLGVSMRDYARRNIVKVDPDDERRAS